MHILMRARARFVAPARLIAALALALAPASGPALGQSYPSPHLQTETLEALPIWKSCQLAYLPLGGGSSQMTCAAVLPASLMPAFTGDVTSPPGSPVNTIPPNVVTNAKAAQMAAMTIKGNNTAGQTNALDLTVAQVKGELGGLPISIVDYGGDQTGANDSAPALTNAIAALSTGGEIWFPRGGYKLNSSIASSTPGIILQCESQNSTMLEQNFTSGNLLTFTGQYNSVRDCSVVPLVRIVSGYEVVFNSGCFECNLHNVALQYAYDGIDISDATESVLRDNDVRYSVGPFDIVYSGTLTNGGSSGAAFTHVVTDNPYPVAIGGVVSWSTSTAFTAGQIISLNGAIYQCSTSGTSASTGSGPSGFPSGTSPASVFTTPIADGTAAWKFVNADLTGILQDNYGYSLRLTNVALLDGYYGFHETDTANTGTSYPKFDFFNDLETDHTFATGVLLSNGLQTSLINGWVGSSLAAEGVNIGTAWKGEAGINQTRIAGNWTNGVTVNGGVDLNIAWSWIGSNSQANSGSFHGISFAANVNQANISNNTIGVDPDIGSNKQGYGIVDSGTSDYLVISDNDLHGNVTGGLSNGASGTHNKVVDNIGYNPVGTTAAASTGTTGSTITAGNSPETHYIKQSATFNAAVTKNSQAICTVPSANVPCVVQLGPNESYSVAWSTTQPTYTKDVH